MKVDIIWLLKTHLDEVQQNNVEKKAKLIVWFYIKSSEANLFIFNSHSFNYKLR